MHKHKINLENKKLDYLVRNIKKDEAGGCGQYGLLGTGLQFSQNLLPASSNIFMNEMCWVEQVHL